MLPVSVIMATHNNERDIPLAVASVLAQKYEDFELIVVNDASTDATPAILQALAARDSRVVLLHNERNSGRALSRNRAIENATGELIAILDADDLAMPQRLDHQVAYMQHNPDVTVLGGWAIAVDAHGRPLEPLMRPTRDADIRRQFSRLGMPFVHSTVMFRRSAVMATGLYDARFKASEDFHLCYRLVKQGRAAGLAEFLTLYRIHVSPNATLVRTRYRWAGRAGWDVFKHSPNFMGSLNLARYGFLSLIPASLSVGWTGVYKGKWNQQVLAREQVLTVQSWIGQLEEQYLNR